MQDLSITPHSFPYLKDKKVAFCIAGSIAATESVKVIRELRRWGADVTVFATQNALKFIGKTSLEWASTNPCHVDFDNFANHIFNYDFGVVFSATANLISQIASGFSANVVTNLIASGLGQKKPIFFCPTMHDSLYQNPFFQENLKKIQQQQNVFLIDGLEEEGKQKSQSKEIICAEIIRTLHRQKFITKNSLADKKILLTGGCIPTYVDNIRMLISHFSGRTSIEIAKHLYYRGADFDFIFSRQNKNSIFEKESFLNSHLKLVKNYDEYSKTCLSLLENKDFILSVAAVADYQSEKYDGKIPSQKINELKLSPTQKVIKQMRKNSSAKMLIFKYEENDFELLKKNALKKISLGFDFVVGNLKQQPSKNSRGFFFEKNNSKQFKILENEFDLLKKVLKILN